MATNRRQGTGHGLLTAVGVFALCFDNTIGKRGESSSGAVALATFVFFVLSLSAYVY